MRRSNIDNPVATVIPIINKFDLSFFFGLDRDSDILVNLPSFHLFVDVIRAVGSVEECSKNKSWLKRLNVDQEGVRPKAELRI